MRPGTYQSSTAPNLRYPPVSAPGTRNCGQDWRSSALALGAAEAHVQGALARCRSLPLNASASAFALQPYVGRGAGSARPRHGSAAPGPVGDRLQILMPYWGPSYTHHRSAARSINTTARPPTPARVSTDWRSITHHALVYYATTVTIIPAAARPGTGAFARATGNLPPARLPRPRPRRP